MKEQFYPRKGCKFCREYIEVIDYKAVKFLQRYLSVYSKIESRKRSGTCMRHQRKLANALKRARQMALLPYTAK